MRRHDVLLECWRHTALLQATDRPCPAFNFKFVQKFEISNLIRDENSGCCTFEAMPPSQLKRLKASLRDQDITGAQKPKKQKKGSGGRKPASDLIQRDVALQQIRESFNPFEFKAASRPAKFEH